MPDTIPQTRARFTLALKQSATVYVSRAVWSKLHEELLKFLPEHAKGDTGVCVISAAKYDAFRQAIEERRASTGKQPSGDLLQALGLLPAGFQGELVFVVKN